MIELSPNVIAAMQRNPVKLFHMVRVYDANQVYIKSTTYYGPLVLSNGWDYVADGILKDMDPPRSSTQVDRAQYTINFADPTRFLAGLTNWTGKNVDSRVGFLDLNGSAYLNEEDTLIQYAGIVDGAAYKITVKDEVGESVFQLICASPVADLEHTKFIYLSRDFIRSRNINDTCCDTVYNGSSSVDLKWGKT